MSTPTGWADDRLQRAYDLIAAVQKDQHTESEAFASMKVVLAYIEDADEAIVQDRIPT